MQIEQLEEILKKIGKDIAMDKRLLTYCVILLFFSIILVLVNTHPACS